MSNLQCGLVFIKTKSDYSNFVTAVIKYPFSNVGFYYSTTYFGYLKHVVIMMDLFGITSIKLNNGPGVTIEQLQKDPGIEVLAIRRLKPVYQDDEIDPKASLKREMDFRGLVSITPDQYDRATPEEIVADLFGLEVNHAVRKTPIQMVNTILSKMVKLEASQEPDIHCLAHLKNQPNIEDSEIAKMEILSLMGTPFNRTSKTLGMGSLLQENELLGPLEVLPTETISEISARMSYFEISLAESIFMEQFGQAFIRLLLTNRDFLSIVVDGINYGKNIDAKIRTVGRQAVVNAVESWNELIQVMNQGISEQQVSMAELTYQFKQHQQQLQNLQLLYGLSQPVESISEVVKNTVLALDVDSAVPNYTESCHRMILQLKQYIKDIKDGVVPTIDLSGLIEMIRRFNGTDLKLPENDRQAAYLLYHPSPLKVPNQPGRMIVINSATTYDDLADFSSKDLIEIDRYIASHSNVHQYGELRDKIARRLSSENRF